jgi:hypothetical protein
MPNLYHTIKVYRQVLVNRLGQTVNKKHYRLGAKVRPLALSASEWSEVDCSGYVRWLIWHITRNHLTIPDGSWNQNKWAMDYLLRPCPYSDCAEVDDRLRIAFMSPGKNKHGHVWVVCNGRTIESYGGHGPGRRAWNVRSLLSRVSTCYVLTAPMNAPE